jgi:hypothetical protein
MLKDRIIIRKADYKDLDMWSHLSRGYCCHE